MKIFIARIYCFLVNLFTTQKNTTINIDSFWRGKNEIDLIKRLLNQKNSKINIVIDPPNSYFFIKLFIDFIYYDKLVLIHGCEPPILNNISNNVLKFGNYFSKIYSFDQQVLNKFDHSYLFCFGSCWVLNEKGEPIITKQQYHNLFTTNKKFKLSFIRSKKKCLSGHKLRYTLYETITKKRSYELFFPESYLDTKIPLFHDSMFHLAIENCQQNNYFTEKIIDCFISYTIPIYWGCPNIFEYFDINGIITFSSKEQLELILDSLTPEDYTKRLDAVLKNKKIAEEKYVFFADRLNFFIDNLN